MIRECKHVKILISLRLFKVLLVGKHMLDVHNCLGDMREDCKFSVHRVKPMTMNCGIKSSTSLSTVFWKIHRASSVFNNNCTRGKRKEKATLKVNPLGVWPEFHTKSKKKVLLA